MRNPKSKIANQQSQIQIPKPKILNSKATTRNLDSQIQNPKSETKNLKSRFRKFPNIKKTCVFWSFLPHFNLGAQWRATPDMFAKKKIAY